MRVDFQQGKRPIQPDPAWQEDAPPLTEAQRQLEEYFRGSPVTLACVWHHKARRVNRACGRRCCACHLGPPSHPWKWRSAWAIPMPYALWGRPMGVTPLPWLFHATGSSDAMGACGATPPGWHATTGSYGMRVSGDDKAGPRCSCQPSLHVSYGLILLRLDIL